MMSLYSGHIHLKPGRRYGIEGGPRNADWELVGAGDHKVKLRCPISGVRMKPLLLFCRKKCRSRMAAKRMIAN